MIPDEGFGFLAKSMAKSFSHSLKNSKDSYAVCAMQIEPVIRDQLTQVYRQGYEDAQYAMRKAIGLLDILEDPGR